MENNLDVYWALSHCVTLVAAWEQAEIIKGDHG